MATLIETMKAAIQEAEKQDKDRKSGLQIRPEGAGPSKTSEAIKAMATVIEDLNKRLETQQQRIIALENKS
jgi:hypothetical protein